MSGTRNYIQASIYVERIRADGVKNTGKPELQIYLLFKCVFRILCSKIWHVLQNKCYNSNVVTFLKNLYIVDFVVCFMHYNMHICSQ